MCDKLLSCCNLPKELDNELFNNELLFGCFGISTTSSMRNSFVSRTSCRTELVSSAEWQDIKSIVSQTGLQTFDLEDFIIQNEVCKCSNSTACLFFRLTDKQKFAGKMLEQGTCRSLMNEALVMKKLSGLCSNIAIVEGIIFNPKFLVLKYYKNGDLGSALIRDNEKVDRGLTSKFPFLRRLRYIRDACKAVNVLHKSCLCHRDLTMKNLILSDDMEHVLLTNFTRSSFVDIVNTQITSTSNLPMVGPPECNGELHSSAQDHGEMLYFLKADIYRLGVTMFEVITKKQFLEPIHHHYLPTELPNQILPPKHIFSRARDLWFAICRCWNTGIEKRPCSWELLDKITELIKNPRAGNIYNLYYNRSPKSSRKYSSTADSKNSSVPVRKFTLSLGESLTTSSSVMESSDALPKQAVIGRDFNNVSSNIDIGDDISKLTNISYQNPNLNPNKNLPVRSNNLSIRSRSYVSMNQPEAAVLIPDSCDDNHLVADQSHITETKSNSDDSLIVLVEGKASLFDNSQTSLLRTLRTVSRGKSIQL